MEKITLFCLPYAGGSALIYNKWKKLLDERVELAPLELAGRGKRYQEPFYSDFTEAIADLYSRIKERLTAHQPYALFGHSMGSLLAYGLSHKIQAMNHPPPVHLFLSGRDAPQFSIDEDKRYSGLTDEQMVAEVKRLGIATPEIFTNPEMLAVFIPILKADFRTVETYRYIEYPSKLDCDITVIYGEDDPIIEHDMHEWAQHTSRKCRITGFPGGHFLIHQQTEQIAKLINRSLISEN